LVVEENTNLISAASEAIQARLALYKQRLGDAGGGAAGAAAGAQPSLETWLLDAAGRSAADQPVPAWVTNAIAQAQAAGEGEAVWLGLDAGEQRIIWVGRLEQEDGGWRVDSIQSEALGLTDLFASSGQNAPAIALVDADRQIVRVNTAPTTGSQPGGEAPGGETPRAGLGLAPSDLDSIAGAALRGDSGVQFLVQNGVQTVVAYAPLQDTPWAIVIGRPIGDLIAPFFRYEQVLPLILMAAAVVSFLTLYFGLTLVVRPVHALIDCATRIGQGNFWAAARSVGGVQEIEELRQALHTMAQMLQSERAAQRDYLRAVTNTQEEERARLARELHDETVQTLIALDHKAQIVQRGLDKHPERTREQVTELRKLTAQATQELRRLSYGLRPLGLDEIGLDSALAQLAQEGRVIYRCQGELRRLAPDKELALYRIAQESLSNARRHAQAECVRMMLVFGPTTVTLGIGDNGVGFALPTKLSDFTRNGHFGLMGITERAQLIGGRLFCEAAPGCGATIVVQAPSDGSAVATDDKVLAAVRGWLAETKRA
jgi:signal transduction histidine kinase